MRVRGQSSISRGWTRTPASCRYMPARRSSGCRMTKKTLRQLKWWTESCLKTSEVKLFPQRCVETRRSAWTKRPHCNYCHTVVLEGLPSRIKVRLQNFQISFCTVAALGLINQQAQNLKPVACDATCTCSSWRNCLFVLSSDRGRFFESLTNL